MTSSNDTACFVEPSLAVGEQTPVEWELTLDWPMSTRIAAAFSRAEFRQISGPGYRPLPADEAVCQRVLAFCIAAEFARTQIV